MRSHSHVDLSRGTNQSGVRLYNERLVCRCSKTLHRSLSKAEIARLTGLSTQTCSVIVKQLEEEELVLRAQPLRGKVGQPAITQSNPEGAFSIGLNFGRRRAELVLMDFGGAVSR